MISYTNQINKVLYDFRRFGKIRSFGESILVVKLQ